MLFGSESRFKGCKLRTTHCEVEVGEVVVKRFVEDYFGFTKEELWRNELEGLLRVRGRRGFQQLVEARPLEIVTENGGVEGLGTALEGRRICAVLDSLGMVHRDVKPANLVVRDGVMTLIDFEWCVFRGSVMEKRNPPKPLGEEWKSPDGFDDLYSMEKCLG